MPYHFLEVAVTPNVRLAQAEMGADQIWLGDHHRESDSFTDSELAFISARDSFYIASVSETGWPYVQHRGGPKGFLKIVDRKTLAFADYRGNRQYISTGNFAANDRACLFVVDYPRRARLKIYMHVEKLTLDADPALADLVFDAGYRAKAERIFRLRPCQRSPVTRRRIMLLKSTAVSSIAPRKTRNQSLGDRKSVV